jgi:hypothetical protein
VSELDQIIKKVKARLIWDFNFEAEHWGNGNFDDSFAYGAECGEQDLLRELAQILGIEDE